ncbi:metalloregulator ArsR/SmtB family transcription factor [Nonomuraea rubra]|uniref:DNA-binding transcriptional ArsR family regulator n=1 Tax=Nonomuraea rubra TaxID=46180 RepID=A0A7X0P0L8_9ACTN|nr:metalloregulator ArsR/SmtB family transcription factor [Nonomuraea rubra]MBB6553091.1 DNA-binding transcriptional ArsR family regulator [Nonomuraea rubra]
MTEAAEERLDEVAGAVADPVRRRILVLLRDGPLPAGEVAERFAISRPAVSRHLRVLRRSGLVRAELVGRQRLYTLDPGPFGELVAWLGPFVRPSGWEHRLDALETEVYRTRRERRTTTDAAPGVPGEESTG